jgi:hypothetical protein
MQASIIFYFYVRAYCGTDAVSRAVQQLASFRKTTARGDGRAEFLEFVV